MFKYLRIVSIELRIVIELLSFYLHRGMELEIFQKQLATAYDKYLFIGYLKQPVYAHIPEEYEI